MSNYENIKPYSDLSHEAKLYGGPDKFKNELNSIGVQDERKRMGKLLPFVIIAVICIWEAVKATVRFCRKIFQKKKAEIEEQSRNTDERKPVIRQYVNGTQRIMPSEENKDAETENGVYSQKRNYGMRETHSVDRIHKITRAVM